MIYVVQPEKTFDNPVDNTRYQAGDEVAIAPALAADAVAQGILTLKPTKKERVNNGE